MFEIFNFTIKFVVQASRETKRKKKTIIRYSTYSSEVIKASTVEDSFTCPSTYR